MSSENYPLLLDEIGGLRQQWHGRRMGTAVLVMLASALLALMAGIAIDNVFHPGVPVRFVLACGVYLTLLFSFGRGVLFAWLEEHRDDYFAAMVERRHPELANRLINALQLGRGAGPGSRRVIEAIVSDAARATTDVELSDCLDRRPLQRVALLALATLLILGIWVGLAGPRFMNGAARVLLPLASIPPYAATRIPSENVKPGNIRIPEGASVVVEARALGAVPSAARLLRRPDGGAWRASDMLADAAKPGLFRATIPQADASFAYYIASGDGVSPRFRVDVVKRPRVERLAVTYTPPPYTGRPAQASARADGEISGLAGGRIAVEVTASKPLREATLITEGENGQIVALTHGTNDRTWRGTFVLWSKTAREAEDTAGDKVVAPTRYQLRLLDTEGYESNDPLWRAINLFKDQPPAVVIAVPGRNLQCQPDQHVALAVDTRDDYGIGDVRLQYRINNDPAVHELTRFPHTEPSQTQARDTNAWDLAASGFKAGDLVQYWASALDRNTVTGPGRTDSRPLTIFIAQPQLAAEKLNLQMDNYEQVLEELVRLQRENRAQTAAGAAFDGLVSREALIRSTSATLARAMEKDATPLKTMVQALDDLCAGLMVDAVRLLEQGRDARETEAATAFRNQSLPVQDKIVEALQALLARLQRNDQARTALRKLAKKDQLAHKAVTDVLTNMIENLNRMLVDSTEVAGKFERLPKKPVDENNQEALEALRDLEEFTEKWGRWAKGSVDEMTKLPTGFVDDFGMRPDAKRIYEEIEKAATRAKAQKMDVALEDLGAALATKMKEDLEVWMMDSPDSVQWRMEEPLANKPMEIPEMPLPDQLEDMIGDLLQKAEDFDEEADDKTSAWGDNLDQAGWGMSDGPISTFSAKGKTGNDLPNNMELSGRAGDGRRGKSTGQMVGDTSRALEGRKTPARVGNERYEPGKLKQVARDDPAGATGGGKKAGSGRIGLQGGTPPDFVRDMQRLSEKQAGVREKAEQVANKLESIGINTRRLNESIQLMKGVEGDLRDLRYTDAARKRRVALGLLENSLTDLDQSTAVQLSRARDLPPELRDELIQSADEAYPEGYEAMLKSYFRALSEGGK